MLELISKASELEKCQAYLEKRLHDVLPEQKQIVIGHPGMSFEVPVWTDGDLWFTSRVVGEPQPNRHWNAFGSFRISDPSHIILEINIPLQGITRRIAGMFAKESLSEDVYLLHRGSIGGGRKGIGKQAFLGWYKQEYPDKLVDVSEGNRRITEAVHVTHLTSTDLKEDISSFVRNVGRFKLRATT
jgi:5-methylcytosine-specific restriction enzyme A